MSTSKPDLKETHLSSADGNHVDVPRSQTEQRGLAYFVTAGLIFINIGWFGLSILMTLLSLFGFDSGSSPAAYALFFFCCSVAVVMGGIVWRSITFHQKGRFQAVAVVSAIPFLLIFILAVVLLIFWIKGKLP